MSRPEPRQSGPTISLIIPCWGDEEEAHVLAQRWAGHPLISEVIIAGVADDSLPKRPDAGIKLCDTPQPNRGWQLNRGAELAVGDILLFHYVDSKLMEEHLDSLFRAMRLGDYVGGGFYRQFDERHPRLRWAEKLERWHCRAFGTVYGDQSLFVRRDHFNRIGGFASIPLMEDVEFSRRLRRSGKIIVLDPPMSSSAENQINQGAWRVTCRNLLFLLLYNLGMSPSTLHKWYYCGQATPLGRFPRTSRGRSAARYPLQPARYLQKK